MKMDKVVLSQWEKLCINDALHDHYDKICSWNYFKKTRRKND